MTRNTTAHDARNRTDEDEPVSDDSPAKTAAALHREVGNAAKLIGEAHTHLSAVRSAHTEPTQIGSDIEQAESDALIQSLEESRDHLNAAIELATTVASESAGDDRTDPDEDAPAADPETEYIPTDLLWNTSGYQHVTGLSTYATRE